MDIRVILILLFEALVAFFLARSSGALTTVRRNAAAVLLIFLSFFIRASLLDYETTDYQWFLTKWVEYYRDHGGFEGLKDSVGNYNIPYLYFLALFSCSSIKDLYLIKLLSIFFDVLLAWGILLLIRNCGGSPLRSLAGFFITLFLPTVILNGAKWAQCDSIYVSLAILGLAVGTGGDGADFPGSTFSTSTSMTTRSGRAKQIRGMLSIVLIALSFSFKLQAVFIMPVYLILWSWKKYNWFDFIIFPLTYILIILPAVILGRPVIDALMLYVDQAHTVGSALNYNAPSMTALVHNVQNPEQFSVLCIVFASAAMLVILAYGIMNRKVLDCRQFLILTVLMVLAIPFFLPHMHDRYFFPADTLTVALACCGTLSEKIKTGISSQEQKTDRIARIVSAVCVQFGSMICYIAYFNSYYVRVGNIFLTNDLGAVAMILAMLCALYTLFLCHRQQKPVTK